MKIVALHLTSEPEASHQDVFAIENAINQFNMARTGDHNYRPVRIFLRDENGTLQGGLVADLWGGWMYVAYLWVADSLRRQGYGKRLLEAAEGEARTFGCHNAFVETYSFQARPFYEQCGYRVIATLNDHPPGHQYYVLIKRLD